MAERAVIQRPYKYVPQTNPNFHAVWLELTPIKIESQLTASFGGKIQIANEKLPTYRFLAPRELQEVLAHTWTDYESIQSRVAGKIKAFVKLGAELKALKNTMGAVSGEFSKIVGNKGTQLLEPSKAGQAISDLTRTAVSNIGSTIIPKVKVDTPLYYESSERRRFTISVDIVAETDPKADVVDVVKQIQELSAPEIKGGYVNIEFPYIFHVRTAPKDFINMKTAALVGVQPTWSDPYIDGYPSRATMQLDFLAASTIFM